MFAFGSRKTSRKSTGQVPWKAQGTFRILLVFIVIAVPAAVFRARCGVDGCAPQAAKAEVPFCSLNAEIRSAIEAGYREGRSPDIYMLPSAGGSGISVIGAEQRHFPWPTIEGPPTGALVLWGHGIDTDAEPPLDAGADDLAPTLATLMGVQRPHPEVRSGRGFPVTQTAAPPRLTVLIVWKGADLDPDALEPLLERGYGSPRFPLGSAPADPAAVLTTLGTGGVPAQHGITGTLMRGDDGRVVTPWSKAIPLSVIAALGDDLDEATDQRALVGSILESPAERGIVGGTWYLEGDEDDVAVSATPTAAVRKFREMVAEGYGTDAVPDLLGIVQSGTTEELVHALGSIENVAKDGAADSVTFALVALPAADDGETDSLAQEVEATIDALAPTGRKLVEAVVPGGVFLDQKELAAEQLEDDKVIDALSAMKTADGRSVFADVFPQIAISLGSYC